MKALAERWKPIALLLCLLLLALALTTFKTRLAPQTSLFERLGLSVVMPLQQAIARLTQRLSGFWNGYINLVHVRQENRRLQRQVEVLQGQLTHYQEAYVTTAAPARAARVSRPGLSASRGGRSGRYRSQSVVRSGYN